MDQILQVGENACFMSFFILRVDPDKVALFIQ